MRLVGRSGVRSGVLPEPFAAEVPVGARREACLAGQVAWEPAAQLEARTAHLLPALFLARVDGKSPVEYITREAQRNQVRTVARRLLAEPRDRLADVALAWKEELAA
jgi:hypothetical protein